ncbi:uncharacterized protein LOC127289260 [Leptopilina boulardi]|uniref:uncharacterized protein LOC127289260 n=1 Tax=Leptopilina boulardi TaxID=63433 RepID=UPI0021F5EA69|nr:uncharacterized protein LOC127289260 [Leptopilina boulardi]
MSKIVIFLLIFKYVVCMEIFLARVQVMEESDPSKNYYFKIKKVGNSNAINVTNSNDKCSNEDEALRTLGNSAEKKYMYGQELDLTWKKVLNLYDQHQLKGHMSIKYESKKHNDVNTYFTLCKDIHQIAPKNAASAFAREIFYKIFITKQEHCIEKRTVKVGDNYYFERNKLDFAYCDANATIRIDLFETNSADCGIGGSGEDFTYNTLRVFFNVKFDDCDGKKYAPFASFPQDLLYMTKLSNADKICTSLSKNPIIT